MECELCGGSAWCPACDGFGDEKCEVCETTGICPECKGTGKDAQ